MSHGKRAAAVTASEVAGMFDGGEVRVARFGGKRRNLIEWTAGKAFAAEVGKTVYVAEPQHR